MEGKSLPPAEIQLRITERPSAPPTRLYGLGKKKFTLYQGYLAGMKRPGSECNNSLVSNAEIRNE